jgi:hypothetical protein
MAKLGKVQEELEFVKQLGRFNLYKVKEEKNDDLLERVKQPAS